MKNSRLYGLLLILFVVSISLTSWYCVNKESKEIATVKKKKESFTLSFDNMPSGRK